MLKKGGLRVNRGRISTDSLKNGHDVRPFFKLCFTVEIIWGSIVEAFHVQCILYFVLQISHESQQNHIRGMKEVSHLLWIWTAKYDNFTTCFIAEQMKRLWEEVVVINWWMQKFLSPYFCYMWLVSFYWDRINQYHKIKSNICFICISKHWNFVASRK